jgi:cytochrome b
LLILVVLGAMAISGTMSNNDILFEGPLAAWVGENSDIATEIHETLELLVFGVIALHLLAIIIYRKWLKIKLVPAMITGGIDDQAPPISRIKQAFGVILLIAMVSGAESLALIGDRFYF